MPQRKEAGRYNEEMRQLLRVAEVSSGVVVFSPGDWNRYVPRHKATKALANAVPAIVVTTRDVEALHKD